MQIVKILGFDVISSCHLLMVLWSLLQADSLRVHGVAIPTAAGIRNVLRHIGAHKDGKQVQVLWISLREEPVNSIYSKFQPIYKAMCHLLFPSY